MYMQLVVPLDGSAAAEAALTYAEGLARPSAGNVELVRVVPRVPQGEMSVEEGARLQGELMAAAGTYLADTARRMRADGIHADWTVVPGDPARGILRTARDVEANIIVISSARTPAAGDLGSVVRKLVVQAPCPVLLVRPASEAGEAPVPSAEAAAR